MRKHVYGCAVAALAALSSFSAGAQDKTIKIAVPGFLSGPAAGPYGIPSRQGAELLIEAINQGKLPPPYDKSPPGLGGAKIEALFVDEDGGNTKQVTEFRNLVQKRGAEIVVGYVSSGTCAAIAPIAEELKVPLIFTICGTPRIFEDAPREYVFRTQMLGTAEAVGAAMYVRHMMPDLKSYTGINQNYAWGQDSWHDFELAMAHLSKAQPAPKPLWPKVYQGEYSSELSALQLAPEELIHSSFWGSDLDAFVLQASTRGLLKQKKLLLTMGGAGAVYRLGKRMPDGIMIAARGPYSIMGRNINTPLNTWFISEYKNRYGTYPTAPAYQTGTGFIALKVAYDKAMQKNGGREPTREEAMAALRGLDFETFTTTVRMALSNGHQAVTDIAFGVTKWNEAEGEPGVTDVKFYKAECINPPEGVKSEDWLKGGMKGATCE
jgi:branched-chain amino acid transport system substrate-binding protein